MVITDSEKLPACIFKVKVYSEDGGNIFRHNTEDNNLICRYTYIMTNMCYPCVCVKSFPRRSDFHLALQVETLCEKLYLLKDENVT